LTQKVWRVPLPEPYVHLISVYGSPSLEHVLEAVLFNRAAFACPTFPAWNPRTVSLPLSDSLSSVLPRLIRWLIQNTLAAQPITGKRGVLWRLRCHTGGWTEPYHQLRHSCLSACVSCAMGGCPVRPFLLRDCSWPENADFRVVHQSYLPEFAAWLCNSPCAMSSV
jgi:hypothetical protein